MTSEFLSQDHQEHLNWHFPTPTETIPDKLETYDIAKDQERTVEIFLNYEKAGRNLSGFCDQLSAQEKKPVLTINNPRQGASLQLGFGHWLTNFNSPELASEFIGELGDDSEYQEKMQMLQEKISQYHQWLGENRNFVQFVVKDPADLPADPSARLDIELSLQYYRHIQEMQRTKDPYYVEMKNKVEQGIDMLREINHLKDSLRAIIFKYAKLWLDGDKIKSFVYTINHFKRSGDGHIEGEFANDGQNKIYETLSRPETILVLADVHAGYNKGNIHPDQAAPYFTRRLSNAEETIQRYSDDPGSSILESYIEKKYLIENSSLIQLFMEEERKDGILTDALEYPMSRNADNEITGSRKRLLGKALTNHPRIFDLQILSPVQGSGKIGFVYGSEERLQEPEEMLKRDNLNRKLRQMEDDLRKNPDWVYKFNDRIPVEQNYMHYGPADLPVTQ